jgi:hypothetical protein
VPNTNVYEAGTTVTVVGSKFGQSLQFASERY